MRYGDFVQQIGMPIFTVEQAERVLDGEYINVVLSRWEKKGEITRLKRGLYLIEQMRVDELLIANYIYQPSYVSLETVLNQAGIIPDVAGVVTSIVTGRPRQYKNNQGIFSYSRVSKELYFGYELVPEPQSGLLMRLAKPEKALLDYVYVRRVRDLTDSRVEPDTLDMTTLRTMASEYPQWVRKVIKRYV